MTFEQLIGYAILIVCILGSLIIIGQSLTDVQVSVLDEVANLKSEMAILRAELKEHDERPEWWEAKNNGEDNDK